VVAMRRLITLVTTFAGGLLGLAAAGVPAQAKTPGPNGQIVLCPDAKENAAKLQEAFHRVARMFGDLTDTRL
jgi:hypothetical protein